MVPFRIVLKRAELGVMIEMPPRELACGYPAGHCVQPSQRALKGRMTAIEDGVVHDLVQEYCEVEDRESLYERQGDPYEWMSECHEPPGRQPENQKLPAGDGQMPQRALLMQGAE